MQREELKSKLRKVKISWQYVWDLLDKLLKENPDYYLKELLFMYQVELDSHLRKIEVLEQKIKYEPIKLNEEEIFSADQLLSWMITDHQAKAIFIDNLLKSKPL